MSSPIVSSGLDPDRASLGARLYSWPRRIRNVTVTYGGRRKPGAAPDGRKIAAAAATDVGGRRVTIA